MCALFSLQLISVSLWNKPGCIILVVSKTVILPPKPKPVSFQLNFIQFIQRSDRISSWNMPTYLNYANNVLLWGSCNGLTLCSPRSTIGTATPLPNSTIGTDNRAIQNELNPIVLHLCTQWHCLELSVNIHWIPIVSYWGELPALSLLLIFKLRYLGILKNNLAFAGSVQSEQRVNVLLWYIPSLSFEIWPNNSDLVRLLMVMI